jgi:AcrR family transcriptional regulator
MQMYNKIPPRTQPVSDQRRKFTRETALTRREALMAATLDLVAEKGVQGATVRSIAGQANVTQGLIRHYFKTKEELIASAYEHHMTALTDTVVASAEGGTARAQLRRLVVASLTPPVSHPRAVALWAGFLNTVQQDPGMRAIHARTYISFRDHIERLTGAALTEEGQTPSPARLRELAIAVNAVLDGLWMEGGALPEMFTQDELVRIGLGSVSAITGIALEQETENT